LWFGDKLILLASIPITEMQTSENFRNNDILPLAVENIDPRIPKIVELRLQGQTWEQIGKQIDLTPRAIYNLRHTQNFQNYIIATYLPKYETLINRYINSGNPTHELEVMKELGRITRAGIPRQIHQTTDNKQVNLIVLDFPNPTKPPKKTVAYRVDEATNK